MATQPDNCTRPSRRKVLRACEPCKARKKRCDGAQPCATCVKYYYNCYFSSDSRNRLKQALKQTSTSDDAAHGPELLSSHPRSPFQQQSEGHAKKLGRFREAVSREAISSTAFSRLLSERLQAHSEDERMEEVTQPTPLAGINASRDSNLTQELTPALSSEEMQQFAASFFESVNPVYTFIRPAAVHATIATGFVVAESDAILLGIAALGSLFMGNIAVSHENRHQSIARSAQTCLDDDIARTITPSLGLVAGLVLKTLYLRSTARLYATWAASCATMHAIAALETDIMDSSRVEKSLGSYFEPRKTLWIARLLNTWISNEYGRPPVKTRFDDLIVPSIPSDSILVAPDEQIIYLYNISESLSPERQSNTEEYEAGIVKLATLNTQRSHDAVLLSRTIMALAFYRRLRSSETAGLKRQIFTHLGEIGIDGLQAAKRLARQQKPWWHLANVPFQLLCAMLVIGTASSFAYIPTALQALEEVEHEMPSSTITEALNISRRLIKLSRLEMTKQMQYLDQCSGASLVNHQTQAKDTQSEPPASELPIPWQMSGPEMQSDPSDFDWSFMPDMDIPLFDLDLYSA